MTRRVVYSPRARQHLDDIYRWIARESGYRDRAEGFVSAILDRCEALGDVPFVGQARDDLRPGLRTIGFRRRIVIAYAVTDDTVQILGVFYGGRDHDALLADGDD